MGGYEIGLTGGIAAGKSTAAARLVELGAVLVDADRIAREVVEPGTPGLAEVVAAFGSAVLDPSGALDRPALGRVVFADSDARTRLERIVHPRVAQRRAELAAEALAADPHAVVVHDVPLLVEKALTEGLDLVVVVDAPDELRVERLVSSRGLPPEDAWARVRAQASRDQRLAAADVVLDGSGTVDRLRAEVDVLWERLDEQVRHAARARTRRSAGPPPPR